MSPQETERKNTYDGVGVTPLFSNICAVITTYRPNSTFPERVQLVSPQVGLVIIVDDGGSSDNLICLENWFANNPKICLWHNAENLGIAASLNIGVLLAKEKRYKWIVTLDDDTVVCKDMIERLIYFSDTLESLHGCIGIIGMSWGHPDDGCHNATEVRFSEKRGIITSGSFFSTRVFDEIGGFRNEFIIGAVDYDFCLRARARGYHVIQISEAGFRHTLGNRSSHSLLGFRVKTYNHDAQRLFYHYRNNLVLCREYLLKDPLYSIIVLVQLLKTCLIVLLFEDDKIGKFRMMSLGFYRGLLSKLGKFSCSGN